LTQTVYIRGNYQRNLAKRLIDLAPLNAVVKIKTGGRSNDQNSKMWAMLNDISRSNPLDRVETPKTWKFIMMSALQMEVPEPKMGIFGEKIFIGYSSSELTKEQMSELIEYMYWFGSTNNVKWSEDYE